MLINNSTTTTTTTTTTPPPVDTLTKMGMFEHLGGAQGPGLLKLRGGKGAEYE